MSNRNPFCSVNPTPICMGTGLIALDVVINGIDKEKAWLCAGGSCGNVLTVLAYLAGSSYPVANFKEDYASDTIKRDMTRWGVNQHFIFNSKEELHLSSSRDFAVMAHLRVMSSYSNAPFAVPNYLEIGRFPLRYLLGQSKTCLLLKFSISIESQELPWPSQKNRELEGHLLCLNLPC